MQWPFWRLHVGLSLVLDRFGRNLRQMGCQEKAILAKLLPDLRRWKPGFFIRSFWLILFHWYFLYQTWHQHVNQSLYESCRSWILWHRDDTCGHASGCLFLVNFFSTFIPFLSYWPPLCSLCWSNLSSAELTRRAINLNVRCRLFLAFSTAFTRWQHMSPRQYDSRYCSFCSWQWFDIIILDTFHAVRWGLL